MIRKLTLLPVFGEALLALWRARIELWCGRKPSGRPQLGEAAGVHPNVIAWAVRRAAAFVPRSTCLVRAIAAQRLLARYGFIADLHIGVTKSDASGFEAHAWIEFDGRILVGETSKQYTPLLNWSAIR